MPKKKIHPETYTCIVCGGISKFRVSKNNLYCSITCQHTDSYNKFIKSWLAGEVSGTKVNGASKHIKRYILETQDNKCAKCGIDNWLNQPIVLELEHKDGDSSNNHISNLECLCPNCHSQTPSYKGANKGKGRHLRRKRYQEGKSY